MSSKTVLLRIQDLLLTFAGAPPEKNGRQYLHEIVANGRNGLDVDKFDYLQRDARCCGVLIAADIDRLRTFSKASFICKQADFVGFRPKLSALQPPDNDLHPVRLQFTFYTAAADISQASQLEGSCSLTMQNWSEE